MADQYKVAYDLSNDAISNYLERPLSPLSRSRHSLTLNISETVRHTDIVSFICCHLANKGVYSEILIGTYTHPTQQCHFE